MKTRLILQSNYGFFAALCDNNIITHYRAPFYLNDLQEVFRNDLFFERTDSQISNVSTILKNSEAINHIFVPINISYSHFLDQYPEWNI